MIRITLLSEGKTELRFADRVLAAHLGALSIFIHSVSVLTSKDNRASRQYRGGVSSYRQVRADLMRFIKRDAHLANTWFTTMIDLYALPNDFPGYAQSKLILNPHKRVEFLEEQFAQDINCPRFVPYIELYEYEALLLADAKAIGNYYAEAHHQPAIDALVEMASAYANSELIDDGQETAPSKRIIAQIPEYEGEKSSAGPGIAANIGLPILRAKCPHFAQWIGRLEALGKGI